MELVYQIMDMVLPLEALSFTFMKNAFLAILLLTPLLLAAVALVVYRCHTVPLSQCSEVYRQYHDMPGIQASFVKDKQINDTLRLDITLLEAEDSAGWELLKNDFSVKEIPPELAQLLTVDNADVTLKLFPKNKPGEPMDTLFVNNDAAAISRGDQTIIIFHLGTEDQYDALVDNKTKELSTKKTKH